MDHCQEQDVVYVVEHQNLWEQLMLGSILQEVHNDSGGYPKCSCHVPISGLQFKHIEEYLEGFQAYNVLNIGIETKQKNFNFYTYILRNQICWGLQMKTVSRS